ncbi:DNA integrity scanning diadenylate cyclase DisA [Clostridium sp. HCP1S3_B4]|uniref:DNA integrity scanning diadenylate cyclase DisA n=1 Tax=unclassified Clostridium TaxID=2614128 RepID=UPI00168F2371|nr:DNA integrity scanning diadenylate cyclase DisA [Clostridium sp.]MDD5794635.1 DNA integrity scanning diadenylate cyclase DisA [Clostridiales bacterium]MDY2729377.1 DNA integrity scanning diadenylate cyclase DisA [Clostridium sp.]NLK22509.1 DNA integrity scanning protein DisA [Clostridiales bacterium]
MRLEKDLEIKKILKIVCPGTALREGLENILRAKTGGLVVLGDNDDVMKVVDGGFKINSDYSPSYVYELAKMDGAIVLSSDLKKIVCANAQLVPSSSVPTYETGTRHRTAHRVAKQTDTIVIAISQRRNIITVYKGDIKYVLRDSSVILRKANQAVQTLEKYVAVLDRVINNLNLLEFQDLVTLFDVVTAIQRTEMVMRIVEEINIYILELGNEGRLISMQLNELIRNIERDGLLLIKDYIVDDLDVNEVYKTIQKLSQKELLSLEVIAKTIGHSDESLGDTFLYPKGYRILRKVPRIPASVIENLIEHFNDFNSVVKASLEDLDKVDGIGEARATAIRNGLKRIKEQVSLNKEL